MKSSTVVENNFDNKDLKVVDEIERELDSVQQNEAPSPTRLTNSMIEKRRKS
jgi:hypothetical protein